MHLKAFPADFKTNAKREFHGYAAVFGNRDSHGDIIQPGAFTRTLNNDRGRIKVLWQHDPSNPIGKPVEMREDETGLFVKARIADTVQGRDTLALIDAEIVTELSIGFSTVVEEYDNEKEVRLLREVKLFEFSPVTWASNELARITAVKQASDLDAVLDVLDRLKWTSGRVESERLRTRIKAGIQNLDRLLVDQEPVASPSGTPQHPAETAPDSIHAALAPLTSLKHKLIAAGIRSELSAFSETLRSKA